MTHDEYCAARTGNSRSSFALSFLYLPEQQRRAITALYAFCREVDDIVDECHDPGIARIKLQWWRDELVHIHTGVPQHPVTRALAAAQLHCHLPLENFQEIIDGMEMDLDHQGFASYKDLQLYCHRVAGVVGLLSAEIFGYSDRATLKYAHELGIALQLTNILRDVREDASRGRVYLPHDDMVRFGVTRADLNGTQTPMPLRKLLEEMAGIARGHYQRAFQLLPPTDRYAQRGGLIMAAIYSELLELIKRNHYCVLERRQEVGPLRRVWLAWQTARCEKRRYLDSCADNATR